ncbi:MAG: 1-deoxy-D-xylulose-5-phosphate synthase [Erysipelotrichaceae bacterium]|nr:1-deoxy-D-xylulose-5-phosphate synthase [Erysipelotrichaceae bacterium]
MALLDKIKDANDIKQLPESDLPLLAEEIRQRLLEVTSTNGGHLASNLGVVEITIALHRLLDFPRDKLIFDVGHQSYVHKMLTGRNEAMGTLRQLDGISGFTDPGESEDDSSISGHASNAISIALGYASAREIKRTNEKVVALIGDGSLTGGMSNEALNNAANLKGNLVIILNDNERSISANVGGLANYLGKIRTSNRYLSTKTVVQNTLGKIPVVGEYIKTGIHATKESIKRLFVEGMFFEDLGLTYIGPIDGNDIEQVTEALESAFRFNEPVIIHALTVKGKGYKEAEKHPAQYHGVDPFDLKTGKPLKKKTGRSYTTCFSDKMLQLAEKDERIVAITAAMRFGTGLYNFNKKYPERFFDVGIAEEHAVAFAAGLASAGLRPVVAIYSTFLQRAYDQMIHDVCMSRLPVIFAVDRAGLVGNDGKTHQGLLDESFLTSIPNMTVMSPKNEWELDEMFDLALELGSPVAIRYPRGQASESLNEYRQPLVLNEDEIMERGSRVCILATGVMVETAMKVRDMLKEKGIEPTVVNVRFLSHVNTDLIRELKDDHELFVTMEEVVAHGSYGQRMDAAVTAEKLGVSVMNVTLPDKFIEHGTIEELRERYGLTADAVISRMEKELGGF